MMVEVLEDVVFIQNHGFLVNEDHTFVNNIHHVLFVEEVNLMYLGLERFALLACYCTLFEMLFASAADLLCFDAGSRFISFDFLAHRRMLCQVELIDRTLLFVKFMQQDLKRNRSEERLENSTYV
ncbi:hypothetical protein NC653_032464 [Populus alba x Populus x berolinensis]|uniref:Uncharacterized protein n=1 Tax=Populus alba x Populus x berolinensis TaxID=444605 RepID=A0AAD6LRG7_9ROSI|nr:hypothetical protein NC653_032464 [Populus alba x Populus x berolinensis]